MPLKTHPEVFKYKRNYRRLCLKHHPDTGDGDRLRLEQVVAAYQSLKSRF